ncbi:hypothetical protein [Kluyvera intermedia]|uniref:hypothetical protein n=1 Tax=Kluyvera intermedia TaxID=61648 RepID=UPI00372D6E68|nr:hypothetical protein [Salmonella enterica subsp. enterica serovar Give]
MAMVKCKECKKEISSKAKTCPHCGVKNPGVKASDAFGGFIFLLVLAGIGYWYFSGDDEPATKEPVKTKVCDKNDGQCIFDAHLVDALMVCKSPIEKASKYDFEWTHGAFENMFSRYINKPEKNQIIYVGDKLKFTNGFNAKVNMTYTCTLDTKTSKLVDFEVTKGRLPD